MLQLGLATPHSTRPISTLQAFTAHLKGRPVAQDTQNSRRLSFTRSLIGGDLDASGFGMSNASFSPSAAIAEVQAIERTATDNKIFTFTSLHAYESG